MYEESDFEEEVLMDSGSQDELEGLGIGDQPLLSASQLVEEMGDFSQGEEPGASLTSPDEPSSWAKEMDTEFREESDSASHQGVQEGLGSQVHLHHACLLYTSPSPRDGLLSRMPSSA